MGSQHSQIGLTDLVTLWDKVPAGGEVIITRNKVTISNCPRLDVGRRVLSNDLKPGNNCGQLMVSLSDFQYRDDNDGLLSPAIRVLNRGQEVEEKKRRQSSLILLNKSEFIPEIIGAGITSTQLEESPPEATPETESDISEGHSPRFSNIADSLYQFPTKNYEGHDYLSETSQTTNFPSRSIAEENMRDLQNFLKQHLTTSGYLLEESLNTKLGQNFSVSSSSKKNMNIEDKGSLIPEKVKKSAVIRTQDGVVLSKKIATQAEQKGMRECHVYFTPRTSAEIWPPLVVTVGEEWDFLKVMRKAIANFQRSVNVGDRDGTHDWLFDYHPNKNIKKIKKELKVLFGPKVITYRDSHLRKSLIDVTGDFTNKMWILQKEDSKQQKARVRKNNTSKSCRQLGNSTPHIMKNRSKSFGKNKSRKSRIITYPGLSKRV